MTERAKFNLEPLKAQRSVERWLESTNERTHRERLRWLSLYCEHMKMTPDEIIDQRKSDVKSEEEEVQRRHEEAVRRFGKQMLKRPVRFNPEKPLAPSTVALGIAHIRSFYAANYRDLKPIRGFNAASEKVYHIPDQKELGRMVEAVEPDSQAKAVILGLAQSGLSTQDLLMLHRAESQSQKFGSLGKQLASNRDLIHVHLVRGKTKVSFDTFFGKAAVAAFKALDGDGYLLYPDRADIKFDSLTRYVRNIVEDAAEAADVEGTVSPHCFRKFFTTQLKTADVRDSFFSDALVEYWTGHSLGKVRGAYFIPPLERQIELYQLAEPRITPE